MSCYIQWESKMARINPAPVAAEEALSKAKVKLMIKKDCAFFATLILQTPVYWLTADEVTTAATDGKNLFFNPDFFMGLDAEERVFLLLHEVMHNVYDHGIRLGFRDHSTWNEAGDYVINDELIQRGFKMPDGGLHDSNYRDMSADEIYEDLIKKKDKGGSNTPTPWPDIQAPPDNQQGDGNPDPSGNGQGGSGQNQSQGLGGIPAPSAQEVADHNKALLIQATQASQMSGDKAGTVPGSLERILDKMLKPKLPWNKILAKFLFSLNKNDYSWRKPNRRFISQGIIMPSLHSEGVGKIDFAVDTSGSVSESDFNHFISEIGYVFKTFNPKEIGVMQFDSILQSNDKCCSVQDFFKIKFSGGGGTRIEPVLEVFKNNDAKALVILTDGYLYHGEELDPKKPVIWCVYSNPGFVPSFGTVIHFDKD